MKKRNTKSSHQSISALTSSQRFQELAGGIVISLLGKVLADELVQGHAMLAHPSAAQLWTVIAIAILGALACEGWRNTAKRHRAER